MRKVLTSLASASAVAVIAVTATGAFFSDSEVSTDNTFVAGAIDLKVSSDAYYNGVPVDGSTWASTDLTDQVFFNFDDVKPGDMGENTIDLTVTSNDSWACADVVVTANDDVSTVDSETDDGDDVENEADPFDGELGDQLNMMVWLDDGDNVYEDDEVPLAQGPASTAVGGLTLALADSDENNLGGSVGDPMVGNQTYYLGFAWCHGTLTPAAVAAGDGVDPTVDPGVNCDGSLLDNTAQTDSLVGDITFRVEQMRNNDGFQCQQV